MESTPSSSKRMKSKAIKRSGRLENWFSGEEEKIDRYLHETSKKVINNPKLITFNWLKEQKVMEVRSLQKEPLLKRFLEMFGNIYPDLVRVFYTNFQIIGDSICSDVKGVDMEITHYVTTIILMLS